MAPRLLIEYYLPIEGAELVAFGDLDFKDVRSQGQSSRRGPLGSQGAAGGGVWIAGHDLAKVGVGYHLPARAAQAQLGQGLVLHTANSGLDKQCFAPKQQGATGNT